VWMAGAGLLAVMRRVLQQAIVSQALSTQLRRCCCRAAVLTPVVCVCVCVATVGLGRHTAACEQRSCQTRRKLSCSRNGVQFTHHSCAHAGDSVLVFWFFPRSISARH
jgi:hypothetical protein